MLDIKDLKDIKVIVQDSLKEFFETVILPYFEHNEDDHKEIKHQLKQHGELLEKHGELLEKHGELLEKHDVGLDKIYRKLEKNEDDHEEIFDKLENINQNVNGYEKRIKKLEVFSGLNN